MRDRRAAFLHYYALHPRGFACLSYAAMALRWADPNSKKNAHITRVGSFFVALGSSLVLYNSPYYLLPACGSRPRPAGLFRQTNPIFFGGHFWGHSYSP
jgi:hypothetical protein